MAVPILGLFFKYFCFLDVPEIYINRVLSKHTAHRKQPFSGLSHLLAVINNHSTCGKNRSFFRMVARSWEEQVTCVFSL